MKHISALERLGLDAKEATIYTMLAKGGHLSASDIVRKSQLHRPAVYSALQGLVTKGLASIVPKGKQKRYAAESPRKIRELFDSSRAEIEGEIDELEREYVGAGKRPIVTYAEGSEAITRAYLDLVNTLGRGEVYYRYSSSKSLDSKRYLPKSYREIRDTKGLERFVITNEPNKNRMVNRLGRLIKTVPSDYDLFNYDISVLIYGTKVVTVDYNTKTVITVDNPIIAEFQKKVFRLLFKKL
ncbi:MAG: helix-turn-helix domain-containing protein [Candidatus Paceibacterota bacterium]|jgi:sugar-specific transcriptional regulator TrmB